MQGRPVSKVKTVNDGCVQSGVAGDLRLFFSIQEQRGPLCRASLRGFGTAASQRMVRGLMPQRYVLGLLLFSDTVASAMNLAFQPHAAPLHGRLVGRGAAGTCSLQRRSLGQGLIAPVHRSAILVRDALADGRIADTRDRNEEVVIRKKAKLPGILASIFDAAELLEALEQCAASGETLC